MNFLNILLLLFSFIKIILSNEILDLNVYKNFTDFPDESNSSISFDFTKHPDKHNIITKIKKTILFKRKPLSI